jgi:hypothetical protein
VYTCVSTGEVGSAGFCPPHEEKTALNQYDLYVVLHNASDLPFLYGKSGWTRSDEVDAYAAVKVTFDQTPLIAMTTLQDNAQDPQWDFSCWFQSTSYPEHLVPIEISVYDHNDARDHVKVGAIVKLVSVDPTEQAQVVEVALKCEESIKQYCDGVQPKVYLSYQWKRDEMARSRMVSYLGVRVGVGAVLTLIIALVAFGILARKRRKASGFTVLAGKGLPGGMGSMGCQTDEAGVEMRSVPVHTR